MFSSNLKISLWRIFIALCERSFSPFNYFQHLLLVYLIEITKHIEYSISLIEFPDSHEESLIIIDVGNLNSSIEGFRTEKEENGNCEGPTVIHKI